MVHILVFSFGVVFPDSDDFIPLASDNAPTTEYMQLRYPACMTFYDSNNLPFFPVPNV